MLHRLYTYVTTLPLHDFKVLLLFVVGAGAASVIVELFKPLLKWFEAHWGMDAKKLTVGLLGLLSMSISLAGDIVTHSPQSLGLVLGAHTAEIMALATAVYHFGGSQTYAAIRKFLNDVANYLATKVLPPSALGKPPRS